MPGSIQPEMDRELQAWTRRVQNFARDAYTDLLLGGDGLDALSGGEGADTLGGGSGNNIIVGGSGADAESDGGLKLDVETPSGMKVGPISYPRALMRKLKFSKGAVAVYEGRAVVRFNVTVPANYSGRSGEIKGKLRFQACNDESCFPPVTREVKMWLNIE